MSPSIRALIALWSYSPAILFTNAFLPSSRKPNRFVCVDDDDDDDLLLLSSLIPTLLPPRKAVEITVDRTNALVGVMNVPPPPTTRRRTPKRTDDNILVGLLLLTNEVFVDDIILGWLSCIVGSYPDINDDYFGPMCIQQVRNVSVSLVIDPVPNTRERYEINTSQNVKIALKIVIVERK